MATPTKRVITPTRLLRPQPSKAVQQGIAIVSPINAQVLALRPVPSKAVSFSTPTASGNSGSNVLTEPVGHLIQHVKQYDPRLYEALQRMGTSISNIQNVADDVASLPQMFNCTVDIFDSTVGNSIAPMQPVQGATTGNTQQAVLVDAILTNTITSDLTLRINNLFNGATQVVGTFDIPSSTPIGTIVQFTTFVNAAMSFGSVLSFDITASDGSKNKYGVASFNLWWLDQSDAS